MTEGCYIEIVRDSARVGKVSSVLFDFDGTISVIREGWQEIMVPMMVEELMKTPRHESEDELHECVREFVYVLTGKDTIFQMMRLAEEVEKRGAKALDPLDYKREYHNRLWRRIEHRVEGLKAGRIDPHEMVMEGAIEFLEELHARGLNLYLASGTDHCYVVDEARALGVDRFFGDRIYGALDNYWERSKAQIIKDLLETNNLHGDRLAVFGDGFVEIENCKEVGGFAIGVASDEANRRGINEWKRERLIGAGADVIIPDFTDNRSAHQSAHVNHAHERKHLLPYAKFDRSKLILEPLAEREHDMTLDYVLPLGQVDTPFDSPEMDAVAERIVRAHASGRQVILMMGAHVIKQGCSRFVIDLMERGMITHVGMNGAGTIHDFELAMIGATTESVAHYIKTGQFGMWTEAGLVNEVMKEAAADDIGLGEAVGRWIEREKYPHRDVSIHAAGYRLGIPVTVHIAIGQDIIHEHPNCDPAALGRSSYNDFLVFTNTITKLEGGVYLNYGTAVMGPEVYLKALSMARNVARQEGTSLSKFTTAVFDLVELGDDLSKEAPKTDARYYYRPFKTILVRTVADGGESFYIRGDHRVTFPNLWKRVVEGRVEAWTEQAGADTCQAAASESSGRRGLLPRPLLRDRVIACREVGRDRSDRAPGGCEAAYARRGGNGRIEPARAGRGRSGLHRRDRRGWRGFRAHKGAA